MYLDTTTVFAGSLGTAIAFGLFRLFIMWKRWSNSTKENEEIDWDAKIAEAIKQGDVEAIARLRKYFLSYKRSGSADKRGEPSQAKYCPDTLYLCKEGRFWFKYDEQGNIEVFKPLKCLFTSGEKASVLKISKVNNDGSLTQTSSKRFTSKEEMLAWIQNNYQLDLRVFR